MCAIKKFGRVDQITLFIMEVMVKILLNRYLVTVIAISAVAGDAVEQTINGNVLFNF